jgi:hypothetical protein
MKKVLDAERAEFSDKIEKLEIKYQKQIAKIRDEFLKVKPS